jgi:hypothetical protein
MANIIKDIDAEVYCGAANVPYTCGANRAIFGRILLKMALIAPQVSDGSTILRIPAPKTEIYLSVAFVNIH